MRINKLIYLFINKNKYLVIATSGGPDSMALLHFLKNNNYNLICVCRGHHREAECGEIERDYLFQLAKDREEGK